jgi:hypothetical protein
MASFKGVTYNEDYGAVHLEAAYIVHQIRKVKISWISYPFSRNAPFHARNISSEAILLQVKIDGDIFVPPP